MVAGMLAIEIVVTGVADNGSELFHYQVFIVFLTILDDTQVIYTDIRIQGRMSSGMDQPYSKLHAIDTCCYILL